MICNDLRCEERGYAHYDGYCVEHADPDAVRVRVLDLEERLRRVLAVVPAPRDAVSERQRRAISRAYDLLPEEE